MSRSVTIVNSNDWQGIYVDDELVYENRSISLNAALVILHGKGILKDTLIRHFFADQRWINKNRTLPNNLKDVKKV